MFYVHLLPLAVLSLSTAHKGRMSPPADCNQPERFPKDNLDAFVSELNRRRKLMVEGNQQNGPQGNGNLPKGENVREMEWSCNLEKKAIAALNLTCPTECPTQSPNVPDGTTGFFYCQNVGEVYEPMGTWLSEMYQEKIYLHPDPGAPVMYRGKNRNYCNLVRYDAYHIGCAETECDGKKLTFCLTNKPPLQINETVYYAGDGACPKGACRPTAIGVCNEDTGLCLTPLPTTTPKPTTKRPKSNDCYFSFFMAGCMM